MFKLVAFFALLAVASAGVVAPVAYSPLAYAGAPVVHAPVAYAAAPAYSAPVAYGAPIAYGAGPVVKTYLG